MRRTLVLCFSISVINGLVYRGMISVYALGPSLGVGSSAIVRHKDELHGFNRGDLLDNQVTYE